MKLYKYTCGTDDKYGVAKDEQDAYERRVEVDPTFHFLAPTIAEVKIPGYTLTITPDASADIDSWDKGRLRGWLDKRNIEYVPQWGIDKLRDAVRAAM